MKVMVFDTETTGLPNGKDKRLEAQPHIVQFAWIVVEMNEDDWSYTELARINKFIKPPIPIPYESSKVHGIYDVDKFPMNHLRCTEFMMLMWKMNKHLKRLQRK